MIGCTTTPPDVPDEEDGARPPLMMFEGVRTTPLDVAVVSPEARTAAAAVRATELAREARAWPERFHRPGVAVLQAVKVRDLPVDGAIARSQWHAVRVMSGTAIAAGADFVLEQPAGDSGPSVCLGLDAPIGAPRVIVAYAAGRIGALPTLAIASDDDGHLAYAVPVAGTAAVRWNHGPVTTTDELVAEVSPW
jgi:hypothetical protein